MLKFSHILFSCCQAGQGRYPLPRLHPFVMKDSLLPDPFVHLRLSHPPFWLVSRGQDLLQSARCSVMSRHVASNLDSLPCRPLGWMTFVTPILVRSLGGLGLSGVERGCQLGAVGSVWPLSHSYCEDLRAC